MARPKKSRALNVWMNGELVGIWTKNPARHSFKYSQSWLDSPSARPLSLSMPLRPADQPYQDELVEAFFDNLLPDTEDIRRRVQSHYGTESTNAFDLLSAIGRDCVGAVQLSTTDNKPRNVRKITAEPISEREVAKHLRDTISPTALGQRDYHDFRISIAGAQEKTALLWHNEQWHRPIDSTPTTHIFKLPLGRVGNMQIDLTTSVENEWLCMQIVTAYGLDGAHCKIASFEDQHVLIIRRFDRRLSQDGNWWMRLPQEDMCQATGTPGGKKYESDGGPGIKAIMSLLLGSRNADADRRAFFKSQILFWLLAAIDGHAKNYSVFIEPKGRFILTPFYDVISAYPVMGSGANQLPRQRAKMAMAVVGKNRHFRWAEIFPRHWIETAGMCGFRSEVDFIINELVEQTPKVLAEVSRNIPPDFPAVVSDTIFEGLSDTSRKLADRSN